LEKDQLEGWAKVDDDGDSGQAPGGTKERACLCGRPARRSARGGTYGECHDLYVYGRVLQSSQAPYHKNAVFFWSTTTFISSEVAYAFCHW
jgi:hypothetical protein